MATFEPGGLVLDQQKTDLKTDQLLVKFGKKTNATEGRFNGLRSFLAHLGRVDAHGRFIEVETMEHSIARLKNSGALFSECGNSGAAVLNDVGQFVGLLFAGNYSAKVSYFIPWKRLFDDIKLITGAMDLRLYQKTS